MTTTTTVQYLADGSPDGTVVFSTSLELGAFWGVTPTAQLAAATQATITATWVTLSAGTGFGFLTSDQIISVIAVIKEIQRVLKVTGIWKGGA